MKKILILTAISGLGYFSSYSQTATATRPVEDPNPPQKVVEPKKDNSLEAEKNAKLKMEKKKSSASKEEAENAEKLRISKEYEKKNAKINENSKSAKSKESTITPVKKN